MAPIAISPISSPASEQDLDLTSSAIEHRLAENGYHTNGLSSNGTTAINGNPSSAISQTKLQDLDASKLTYAFTKQPREVPAPGVHSVDGSTICTDHMITASWSAKTGWKTPELKPYGPLTLMPTASVLHYATECFEGMKAYRGYDGKLRLFRPDCNSARMLTSAVRISLPPFPPTEVERLIFALLAVDGPKWLPRDSPGHFIYLRPTLIGTDPQLGVNTPAEALLYIIATFLPKMDEPEGGLRLHTSPDDMVRAWVGGFGYAKVGANYGPSLAAMKEARARGFHQILWLYGKEGLCTEAGASNFFVIWKSKEDPRKIQIVTAPLDDRLILDGVTRRSVLALARERLCNSIGNTGEVVEVVERKYTIDEVFEAHAEGRLLESLASGTAFFVCPVSVIHHRGRDIKIPMGKAGAGGPLTLKIKGWLRDIMYGNEEHEWGVVVREEH